MRSIFIQSISICIFIAFSHGSAESALKGDVNQDGDVGLLDVILGLKALAGDPLSIHPLTFENDVDGDDKIGLAETLYALEVTAAPNPPASTGTITSATGQIWMDRNLGASRVATNTTDSEAYGDLYQWGRFTDGHEKRTSSTTSTQSNNDVPGHASFILSSGFLDDWRTPQNTKLWQGAPGINNPCPSGFRLPTATELEKELIAWSSKKADGAFASSLKIVAAGYRDNSDGLIYNLDTFGSGYWSSTVYGAYSRGLYFSRYSGYMANFARAAGLSVRCIKD